MNKTTFAISAMLSFLALGSSAAMATVLTATSQAPLSGPPGVDDALQIWQSNTTQIGGFPILLSAEASCSDPASIGGCSFSLDKFTPASGVVITPKASMENQIAVFYLPDGVTIDAIFALGCDTTRDNSTGLCNGTPNFTVLTPDPAHPFNLSLLSGAGVTIGFTGTELPGTSYFDLGNYITVANGLEGQTYSARLVLNNVPEPITLSLFGAGLVGAVAMRRRKQK